METHETHPMYQFFRYFPEAVVMFTEWDKGGQKTPVRDWWYNIPYEDYKKYNQKKLGAFFTACDMTDLSHTINYHKKVRAWFCDIDVTTKQEEDNGEISEDERAERKAVALGKIHFMSVKDKTDPEYLPEPSFVIEARNGFHIYWLAWAGDEDYEPGLEMFSWIQENIGERIGGDPKAQKTVQLMRVPGLYNWKRGGKFPCRILPELNYLEAEYCENEWLQIFGAPPYYEIDDLGNILSRPGDDGIDWSDDSDILMDPPTKKEEDEDTLDSTPGVVADNKYDEDYDWNTISFYGNDNKDDIFEIASGMDQREALMRLSGSPEVNGEIYTFSPEFLGKDINGKVEKHVNIIINGQSSSCWISLDRNEICVTEGVEWPNIIEWVKYYDCKYHEKAKDVKPLKEGAKYTAKRMCGSHELALILRKYLQNGK